MFKFGTKAETLKRLETLLKGGTILPQLCFDVEEWREGKEECIEIIQLKFGKRYPTLIVRSSAIAEDSANGSKAGVFESVADVAADDKMALGAAIQNVIDSYGKNGAKKNQVLVQPFLTDIAISGVIFTRTIDMLAPYYVINYDDQSKATDSVTSGRSKYTKTLIRFRISEVKNKKFKNLFIVVKELEEITDCDYLDIEFAIGTEGSVYILQVRPIAIGNKKLPDSSEIWNYINKIYKKIVKLNKPHPYLHGHNTIFGIMPDWNPAEMIGVKPRPLPLSLYKEFITDRTWAYQRSNYGYRNVRSFPLMVTFLGMPYIDVRVSFNSFIPADINNALALKLTNYYIEMLRRSPHSHDKVEFDIILSCYFFSIDERLKKLRSAGFTATDIDKVRKSLLGLTKNIIEPDRSVFRIDQQKIKILKVRRKKIMSSKLTVLEKIYWLSEDCKRYGTLPFAGLARAGFIAVQMLHSLVDIGVISLDEKNQFMASLNTTAKRMVRDRYHLSREEFIEFYGHLRPGTYDILSLRYDEAYDYYFDDYVKPVIETRPFKLEGKKKKRLDSILKATGFVINASDLMKFFKEAIEWREYAKFIFTKNVSDILRLIKELGKRYSLSVDELSYIDIRTLLDLYALLDHRDLFKILREEIDYNRHLYEINKYIRLPHIILKPTDIYEFELEGGIPNFIGPNRCEAEVVTEKEFLKRQIRGKIVFIPSADPGYDWIFSKKIVGLVTMFGGANSHMAIRAAELRIPAVIGAGEKNYNDWSVASVLEIDSENKQVRIIR